MTIKCECVRFGSEPETGYFCYPEAAARPLPAIVVIQEAWGVDAHIEDLTRRFAAAGYAALAPDIYAEKGERLAKLSRERLSTVQAMANMLPATAWRDSKAREAALANYPGDESGQGRESFEFMLSVLGNHSTYVPKLLAATKWLREEQPITKGAKIASVGFCMGGSLSARLAGNDPQLAGAVIFYGRSPEATLAAQIQCPLLGLYGKNDEGVNATIPDFEAAMEAAGKSFDKVVYEGAGHAFFNDGRPSYHAPSARSAFVRSLEFMNAVLSP